VEYRITKEDIKLQADRRMLKGEEGDIDGETEHQRGNLLLDGVEKKRLQDEGLAVSEVRDHTSSC
jgi:hypothetical protein